MSSRNGGLRILPGGGSAMGGGSGAFVRRYVSIAGVPTLAGNTRTGLNNAGETEAILENPNGPVHGLIPQDVSAVLMGAGAPGSGDGGRFGTRLRVLRGPPGSANISLTRFLGTYQAPAQVTGANVQVGGLYGESVDNAAGLQAPGAVEIFQRETVTTLAAGGFVRIRTPEVGSVTLREIVRFQAGGAAIGELMSGLATLRLIPGASAFVIRDSANTADLHSFNASGTSVVLASSPTTADLSIGSGTGTGNTNMQVRGGAGLDRNINWMTGTSLRWIARADNVAESGANAGSNWGLHARTDAGGAIDSPITIIRAANGAITFGGAGNRQVIIAGAGWGAGNASLRLNGLTSGAGVAAGTLNNAPAAGDPAFWLPVSIAGTVRYIPCW